MKEDFVIKKQERHQLAYEKEFRVFIRQFPNIIATFRKLETALEALPKGSCLTEASLTVTSLVIDYQNDYFKVEINGKQFFIKREKREHEERMRNDYGIEHSTINEISATEEARDLLKGVDSLEIVEPKLAYRDEQESYFVSAWIDAPTLADYMVTHPEKKEHLAERYKKVIDVLEPHGYQDLLSKRKPFWNVLYDEKKDKLILIDLHKSL